MPTWDSRANDLFLKALELHSPSERQAYVDGACSGDAARRAEVETGGRSVVKGPMTGTDPTAAAAGRFSGERLIVERSIATFCAPAALH